MENMKIELTHKKKNHLLHRTEVSGTVTFAATTPSKKNIREAIAKTLNTNIELVVSKHIYNTYGGHTATIEAVAYDNPEKLQLIETKKGRKQVSPEVKTETKPTGA